MINLKSVIEQIIEKVSFSDYLLYKGYLKRENNLQGWVTFQKKQNTKEEDTILLSKINNIEYYYSLKNKDKGNVIDFVKNRIEKENELLIFEPSKNDLIESCKKLVSYITEFGEKKENRVETEEDTNKINIEKINKNAFSVFYELTETDYHYYFNTIGISKEVVSDPIFNDKILVKENNEEIITITFPIYDELKNECGMYANTISLKSNKLVDSYFLPGSNDSGIWISNKPDVHRNNKLKFTIVDQPIEALGHYSYNNNQPRQYGSVFNVNETTYEIIKRNLNQQNSTLILALSVKLENFEKEIKIIISLLNANINFVKTTANSIVIKIFKSEELYFEKLLRKIKQINTENIQESIKTLGDSAKKYLESNIIIASKDKEDLVLIIPRNFKTLYYFEKIMIKTFPSNFDIAIEKPKHINWITQNQKGGKLMQEEKDNQEIFIIN